MKLTMIMGEAPWFDRKCLRLFGTLGFTALAWINYSASWVVGADESPIKFTDVTAETGIEFTHYDGSDGRHFSIESMTAGIALFDFDNDDDLDLFVLNGAPIDTDEEVDYSPNRLFRNDGNFKFTDVTEQAGVADFGFGLGVGCADFDNDGWVDVYVNNFGANVFYRNNGDGTFLDVTHFTHTSNGTHIGGGVSFFDMDADGDLDLYAANYILFDVKDHKVHIHKGLPSYPSPLIYEPAPDTLYRNEGDGTFTDVSESSGITAAHGRSMAIGTFDCDQDGDIDIVVANDSQENFLFLNDGTGVFEESALLSGIAMDYKGRDQASMGVDISDWNSDGLPDVAMTSFSEEFVIIYQNVGSGFFDDVTLKSGIGPKTYPHVTWGINGDDFDLDGFRDLFIGAGDLDDHFNERVGEGAATAFKIPNLLFQGLGNGQFRFLDSNWGSGAKVAESARGTIAGDLDGDGDPDIVVLNSRSQLTVLRNDSPTKPHLRVRLIGITGNRDGIGVPMLLTSPNGHLQYDEMRSGRSYQGDQRGPLTFALQGNANGKSTLKTTWPGGAKVVEVGNASQTLVIIEPSK